MPHVQPTKDIPKRKGQFSKSDINKTLRPALARDQLSAAFAGKENNGDGGPGKLKSQKHSTNVKSRQSKQSKLKERIK